VVHVGVHVLGLSAWLKIDCRWPEESEFLDGGGEPHGIGVKSKEERQCCIWEEEKNLQRRRARYRNISILIVSVLFREGLEYSHHGKLVE
jgi:hypothetical protein